MLNPFDDKAARQVALKTLGRRDFAQAEMRAKLIEKGFDPTVAATVVDALVREGMLNDVRYGGHFVAYHAGRGRGPVRIRRELATRGLEVEQIDEALNGSADTEVDWIARARELRRRKFGAGAPATYAEKAKQFRFLQYRGFTGAQIRAALDTDLDIDDT